MVEFMLMLLLGNMFAMAIVILLIGFMFLLRVMLNLWFDTDFFKRILEWFKRADAKMKQKHAEMEENERTILVVDEDMTGED